MRSGRWLTVRRCFCGGGGSGGGGGGCGGGGVLLAVVLVMLLISISISIDLDVRWGAPSAPGGGFGHGGVIGVGLQRPLPRLSICCTPALILTGTEGAA